MFDQKQTESVTEAFNKLRNSLNLSELKSPESVRLADLANERLLEAEALALACNSHSPVKVVEISSK